MRLSLDSLYDFADSRIVINKLANSIAEGWFAHSFGKNQFPPTIPFHITYFFPRLQFDASEPTPKTARLTGTKEFATPRLFKY